MEDMKIAMEEIDPEAWNQKIPLGLDHSQTLQDWIEDQSSFEHHSACEYILYIGDNVELEIWPEYQQPSAKESRSAGFKYICYYA